MINPMEQRENVFVRAEIDGDQGHLRWRPMATTSRQTRMFSFSRLLRSGALNPHPSRNLRECSPVRGSPSSAWVHAMQCGPSFTNDSRAPLTSSAVRSPAALIWYDSVRVSLNDQRGQIDAPQVLAEVLMPRLPGTSRPVARLRPVSLV